MDFYRFPAMKELGEWDIQAQLQKIMDETDEAIVACSEYGLKQIDTGYTSPESEKAREEYLMELMDVIHCAETAFRMEDVDDAECERVRQLVIEKNRKRGYYGGNDEIS